MPKNVFLVFGTLALVLNTNSGQDSRSCYTFEKSFLEQQHTRSNFERPLCVLFSKQRNSLSSSQNFDILLLINRRNVKKYHMSVLILFEEMSIFLEPSAKRLKLTLKQTNFFVFDCPRISSPNIL